MGREAADDRVEMSLSERAVGCRYPAVKVVSCDGAPTTIRYEEFAIPDVAAQRLWLTNRRPDRWRDRSSKEISGPNGGAIEINSNNMSDLEVARRSAFTITRLLMALPKPEDGED